MNTQTHETTNADTDRTYQFEELSDSAKNVARNWYRDDPDLFDAKHVFEFAQEAANMIGIHFNQKPVRLMNGKTTYEPDIRYQGFSYQGDGASFAGTYSYVAGGAKAIAAEFPEGPNDNATNNANNDELNRIARTLEIIQRLHGNSIAATVSVSARCSHSRGMDIEIERTDAIADPLHNPLPDATEQAVTQLLRDFADWIYASLKAEYEYVTSDEAVDESIISNEYEFDEDGNRT